MADKSTKPIFIIVFQRMPNAPPPPFVAQTTLSRNETCWMTKYGRVNKGACVARTFLNEAAAKKELPAYRKILNEKTEKQAEVS